MSLGTTFRGEVLKQTDDAGNLLSRYATAGASYYGPLLGFESPDGSQRYPLYDMAGTARRLADASGAVTDGASLDAFGRWVGRRASPWGRHPRTGLLSCASGAPLPHPSASPTGWATGGLALPSMIA